MLPMASCLPAFFRPPPPRLREAAFLGFGETGSASGEAGSACAFGFGQTGFRASRILFPRLRRGLRGPALNLFGCSD